MESILRGKWDDRLTWEFHRSISLPPLELCSAVYCLAVTPGGKSVVLTRNQRGWEMPGGHIEPGETVEQAMIRECQEEIGCEPQSYRVFGYRIVESAEPVPHKRGHGYYPFPYSYIPHFVALVDEPLAEPSGEEVLDRREFMLHELPHLQMEQWPIIRIGLDIAD